MLRILQSRGANEIRRRAFATSASAVEEPVTRKGSCTVPVAFTKFDAKEDADPSPPVVLLHGLLGNQMSFRSLVKKPEFGTLLPQVPSRAFDSCFYVFLLFLSMHVAAPKRDIYTLDMRNHGLSPHTGEMDLHALSRDVSLFLDNEGIEAASIVGTNIGGKVGMILALEQSDRVSDLVVVDGSPLASDKKLEFVNKIVQLIHDVEIKNYTQKKDIEEDLKKGGIEDERLRQFLMMNVVSDNDEPGFYKWRHGIQAIQEAMPALMNFPVYDSETYTGKSLFAFGKEWSEEEEAAIKKLFPNAAFQSLESTGPYYPAIGNTEKLTEVLNEHLRN